MASGLLCPMCTSQGVRACSACLAVRYCSAECQEADWGSHKLLCRAFGEFASPASDALVRAIVFPADQDEPHFVWIGRHDPGADASSLLGGDCEVTSYAGTDEDPVRVELHYRCDHPESLAAAKNRSILALVGSEGALPAVGLRGPVVALARKGERKEDEQKEQEGQKAEFQHGTDISMSTYSRVVASLRHHRPHEAAVHLRKAPKIKGVRVACDGEMALDGKPRFREMQVPRLHPVLGLFSAAVSPISERVGFPLVTVKIPRQKKWESRSAGGYSNQAMALLQVCCDPNQKATLASSSLGFGWAPAEWDHDPSSVLVYRRDGNALSVADVDAFVGFCCHCRVMFARGAYAEYTAQLTRHESLQKVTAAHWERYRANFDELRRRPIKFPGLDSDLNFYDGTDDEIFQAYMRNKMAEALSP